MKRFYRIFRKANLRITLLLFKLMMIDEKERRAYFQAPYAWLMMLIPIAGIAGFIGVGWEWDIARRRYELEMRKTNRTYKQKEAYENH